MRAKVAAPRVASLERLMRRLKLEIRETASVAKEKIQMSVWHSSLINIRLCKRSKTSVFTEECVPAMRLRL